MLRAPLAALHHRRWALAWLLAAVLHLGAWAVAAHRGTYRQDDSVGYLTLAHNWAAGRGYSQQVAPPHVPDIQRLPGYPALLAAVPHPRLVLALQHALALHTAWLLGLLGARWVHPRWGRWLGPAYALQPLALAYASLLLTETAFIWLTLAALVAWARWQKAPSRTGQLALAMVAATAATAFKPLGVALVGGLAVGVALARLPWRQRLGGLAWVALPLLLVGLWAARHQQLTGRWGLTNTGAIALVYGHLGGVLATQAGHPAPHLATAEPQLVHLADSALTAHLGHPHWRRYLHHWPQQEGLLLHPQAQAAARQWLWAHWPAWFAQQAGALARLATGLGHGTWQQLAGWSTLATTLAGLQALWLLGVAAGLAMAFTRPWRWPSWMLVVGLVAGAYLLLHTAVWADGRYRLVADPLLLLLAGWGYAHGRWPQRWRH